MALENRPFARLPLRSYLHLSYLQIADTSVLSPVPPFVLL